MHQFESDRRLQKAEIWIVVLWNSDNLVFISYNSTFPQFLIYPIIQAGMAELVDAQDLKDL